jgi:hypothetical protein
VLGVVAVVLGIALVFGLSLAVSHGQIEPKNLGDREFQIPNANAMARTIARDGPTLYPDASGGKTRDIYVQHVGGRWYAIAAGPRTCSLRWTGRGFTDPCTKASYPADGAGLTRYRTRLEKNTLFVDFTATLP